MCARALLFTCLSLLSACAPVILGRTPMPAPVGQTDVSAVFGYPLELTQIVACESRAPSDSCFFEYVGPDYWPLPMPLSVTFARGLTETQEFNITAQLVPYAFDPIPGVRFGGKDLVLIEPGLLAADYGASLYLSNLAVDAGVLGSVPLGEAEFYGGLRGFGSFDWTGSLNFAASLHAGRSCARV